MMSKVVPAKVNLCSLISRLCFMCYKKVDGQILHVEASQRPHHRLQNKFVSSSYFTMHLLKIGLQLLTHDMSSSFETIDNSNPAKLIELLLQIAFKSQQDLLRPSKIMGTSHAINTVFSVDCPHKNPSTRSRLRRRQVLRLEDNEVKDQGAKALVAPLGTDGSTDPVETSLKHIG